MTAREIAHSLQVSVPHAAVTLHRLVLSGAVIEVDRVPVEWMKRPAARYRIAPQDSAESAWEALTRWPALQPRREPTPASEGE